MLVSNIIHIITISRVGIIIIMGMIIITIIIALIVIISSNRIVGDPAIILMAVCFVFIINTSISICMVVRTIVTIISLTTRPPYGGESVVCVYVVHVYIGLCFVFLLWLTCDLRFLSMGRLWGLGPFEQSLDHFGEP